MNYQKSEVLCCLPQNQALISILDIPWWSYTAGIFQGSSIDHHLWYPVMVIHCRDFSGIKHWSPSLISRDGHTLQGFFRDQALISIFDIPWWSYTAGIIQGSSIDLHLWYPVMVIHCRDNSGIKHWSLNCIEIKLSRSTVFTQNFHSQVDIRIIIKSLSK